MKNNYLNLSIICDNLCEIDQMFPPNDLWIDYYNINNLQDLIMITIISKKKENLV